MDISENTDFTKLPEAELLLIKEKWAITLDSKIYKKTIDEICRRQQVKEEEIYKTQQQNKKTQRKIKIMTFVIMIGNFDKTIRFNHLKLLSVKKISNE